MRNTAVVINAGIGALTLGFKMAGFEIISAYESDKKAAEIHRANYDIPVFETNLAALKPEQLPDMNLLVGQVNLSTSYVCQDLCSYELINKIRSILHCKYPHACFLLVNVSLAKSKQFTEVLDAISNGLYNFSWSLIDVGNATGFPVNERMACAVGFRQDANDSFSFPSFECDRVLDPSKLISTYDCCSDSWYYDIREHRIIPAIEERSFLCWKEDTYRETARIQWNFLKPPLVNNRGELRKISFHEVAALKGFPDHYYLNESNKQWLYKTLMYSGNVSVLQQIAEQILRTLQGEPQWKRTFNRAILFEEFIGRHLRVLCGDGYLEPYEPSEEIEASNPRADFMYRNCDGKVLLFEVKWYSSRFVPPQQINRICYRLLRNTEQGIPILIVANEVASNLKRECQEKYGVSIWDIRNLLWLLKDYPNLRNDFIAFLDRTIDHIIPEPPIPELLEEKTAKIVPEPTWKEHLAQVRPGKEHATKYETTCTDILKYILGDYLTLWKTQEKSNDGLYRFDLCCKIKSGTDHDFFDTIKHYFNTKYIVFEFKNYVGKIGQEEIYTTEKYLYEKALRKVAIIISRMGADDHATWAAKGALRENGKLILCLNDQDILDMVQIKEKGEQEPADFLGNLLDDLLVHLEK